MVSPVTERTMALKEAGGAGRRVSARRVIILMGLLLLLGAGWRLYRLSRTRKAALQLEEPFPVPAGEPHTYTTNFAAAESPISDGGQWISGKAAGLDWSDVYASPGLAYGTESGFDPRGRLYADSTAVLAGSWKPDQTVEATVYSVNQRREVFEEVELRLRSSLSAHTSTGYEVLFRCLKTPEAYASIVRWDGSLGKFTYLAQKQGLQYGVSNGDVVKATVAGNVITAYINGVPVMQATDTLYPNGNPGMGFWLKKESGLRSWWNARSASDADYGFTRFAAWD
jgi:hypothetical protein